MHPFRHFATITRHRHRVIVHCFRVGIGWQGLRHDLSKYSPAEFWSGARYYQGTRSPNEQERAERGYSAAWLHHKGRNRHHFEYWSDYSMETKQMEPVKMPIRYVAEMFCDRVAACRVYQGNKYTDASAYDYYRHSKTHIIINADTDALIVRWLLLLKEQGEKAAIAQIRAELRTDTY